jgi:hypothetical protein
MRPWIAEINEHAVAHILRDKPVETPDDIRDGAMIGADHLPQILGIEPRGQRGRADKVAEHHRELPPLGIGGSRGRAGWRCQLGGGRCGAERSDCSQQLSPVTDRGNADTDQVV